MNLPDPDPLPPQSTGDDPFTSHDRALGAKGVRSMQVVFAVVFFAWFMLVMDRMKGLSNRVAAPLRQPFWTRLLLEATLIEGTLVLATVVVPLAMAFRRSRLSGAATAAARRPAAVRGARTAVLSVCLGIAEGVIVFVAFHSPFWWAITPIAIAAFWWAFNLRPLAMMRLQLPLQPTTESDRWPTHLASLGSAAAEVHTWSLPVRHHSTEISMLVARQAGGDHMIAWDTLDDLAPDEQRAMVAHEFGHVQLGHYRATALLMTGVRCLSAMAGVLLVVATVGLDHRTDPRAYATFRGAAFFVSIYVGLLAARRRKRWENDADAHALGLTRDPAAFERMVVALTRANRAAVSGSAASSSCGASSPAERVQFAKKWAAAHSMQPKSGPTDLLG